MTKAEAWQRHLLRVRRLKTAESRRKEALALKAELMQQGYAEPVSERIVRESWNYLKGQEGKGKR